MAAGVIEQFYRVAAEVALARARFEAAGIESGLVAAIELCRATTLTFPQAADEIYRREVRRKGE